jgi:hypothetical protein
LNVALISDLCFQYLCVFSGLLILIIASNYDYRAVMDLFEKVRILEVHYALFIL